MIKKNEFIIWGNYCNKCGNECSILQNQHHPWNDTTFSIKLKCNFCGNEVIVDTDRYFEEITKIVNNGIRQIAWYLKDNSRMKNKLTPHQVANEYTKRGWNVELKYLDWYKYGYFINAYKL